VTEGGASGGPFLTVDQVARRLGVSATFVRRLIEDRALGALRLVDSHVVRIPLEDLEAYLRASRVGGAWDKSWKSIGGAARDPAPAASAGSAGTPSAATTAERPSSPGSGKRK